MGVAILVLSFRSGNSGLSLIHDAAETHNTATLERSIIMRHPDGLIAGRSIGRGTFRYRLTCDRLNLSYIANAITPLKVLR